MKSTNRSACSSQDMAALSDITQYMAHTRSVGITIKYYTHYHHQHHHLFCSSVEILKQLRKQFLLFATGLQ
jgi:hypothetical protein